jgi:hypothetical protein
LQISRLQFLVLRDEQGHQTDGTTHDHPRNGSTSACRSSLMGTSDAKTMLKSVIGPRQVGHIVAMKKPMSKALGDLGKMIDGAAEFPQACFLPLHLRHKGEIALLNLYSRPFFMARYNIGCLIDECIGIFDRRPERCGPLQSLGEKLVQLL